MALREERRPNQCLDLNTSKLNTSQTVHWFVEWGKLDLCVNAQGTHSSIALWWSHKQNVLCRIHWDFTLHWFWATAPMANEPDSLISTVRASLHWKSVIDYQVFVYVAFPEKVINYGSPLCLWGHYSSIVNQYELQTPLLVQSQWSVKPWWPAKNMIRYGTSKIVEKSVSDRKQKGYGFFYIWAYMIEPNTTLSLPVARPTGRGNLQTAELRSAHVQSQWNVKPWWPDKKCDSLWNQHNHCEFHKLEKQQFLSPSPHPWRNI